MPRRSSLLLLAFMLVGLSIANANSNDIIVKNLKVYVNCQEFWIKAMCYSPTPLGRTAAGGQGGLCSSRTNVYGGQESACVDEDFWDGSTNDPARNPPAEGWFTSLWDRDFPVMQELGINTIRIYHASPFTEDYAKANIGATIAGGKINTPYGKNHKKFMDKAAEFGFKVIFPLPAEEVYLRTVSEEDMQQMIRNIVDEVGNHSALLMWGFGNELPLDTTMVNLLNGYMAYARTYTLQKWGRNVPITHAVVDFPPSYDRLAETLGVDVFSTNAGYRGLGFSDLFTGAPASNFSGWAYLSQKYNKPVFISEVGWMQQNHAINEALPNWFNQVFSDAMRNQHYGLVGIAFFEYSDELNKVDPLQQSMGVVNFSPVQSNGQTSMDTNVLIADNVAPNPFIFDSIGSGTFNGIAYNMNVNVFKLLNRSADVLSQDQCVPLPYVPPSATTGTGHLTTSAPVPSSTTGIQTSVPSSSVPSSTASVPSSTVTISTTGPATSGPAPASSTVTPSSSHEISSTVPATTSTPLASTATVESTTGSHAPTTGSHVSSSGVQPTSTSGKAPIIDHVEASAGQAVQASALIIGSVLAYYVLL